MANPITQRLKVTVEYEFDADIYEGDPTDAFEIAELERRDLAINAEYAVSNCFGVDAEDVKVRVVPILLEES